MIDKDERPIVGSNWPTKRSFLQRWLPHPLLTIVLVLLWMALRDSFTFAGLLGGVVLGIAIPIYTAHFWPERPLLRSPLQALVFLVILIFDIAVANMHVAFLILFRRSSNLRTRWIVVPLDLTSAEAITVLIATITLTPGTLATDLATDRRSLLIHCLDVIDEEKLVQHIKSRYESRIQAIFP
jgi:multicomponent K+:H+ antiporter subunit E